MSGIMVAVEGLDIVGKTTIAQSLSKTDGWLYYKTPAPAYYKDCVQLGTDGHPVYSEERFWLFIKSLKYSSQEISRLLEAGVSVAVDRWLWTTLSYHFAFNSELEARWQKVAAKEIPLLIYPQLSILVQIADRGVYEQRKASRSMLTAHDKMVVNNEMISGAILHNFKRLNPSFLPIDNSGDLELTMDVVWKHIAAIKALN